MVTETDVVHADGRTLHVYDAGAGDERLAVFWHHGTPNVGAPPEPLLPAAAERGIRWVSYDRPGYGGSSRHEGRSLSSAASDVATIANALEISQFAVFGHSGGSAHALACSALLPERVLAAVCVSGLAPVDAPGLDWFAGIGPAGVAQLNAAARGREALERHLATADYDPEQFTPADHAALQGPWSWFESVVQRAFETDSGGYVDDELAYVTPWGFDPASVRTPVLFMHGGEDRMVTGAHGSWLAGRTPGSDLWLRPDAGHLSVLGSAVAAMDWLVEHAAPGHRRHRARPVGVQMHTTVMEASA